MTGLPIKTFKNLVIKIILIIILYISIVAGESGIQANGGYITRNDFAVKSYTEHWLGFYGVITNNTMTVESFDVNNITPHIFSGISVHSGDYLVITTSPSPPDISGLKAGNTASIDEITGPGDDSGSNTFTYSSTYRIPSSGAVLVDVPSIYILDSMGHYSMEALLADINGDPVFAVPVEPGSGENNETYYFQFMLPGNSRLNYYLFYLQSGI
ncbi:MAG: hypothetical protein FIB07_02080 [Candidatus Methanoperedens sp.]|nr:hypothetical protein [Candidatus Methanoperedens sp.]